MARTGEALKVSPLFYLKNVAVMFLLAAPITAVVTAFFGAIVPEDPTRQQSIGELIRANLQATYFLAWPIFALLSVLHSGVIHAMALTAGLLRRSSRILVGVTAGLIFALVISLISEFSLGGVFRLVADYVILGGVYGVLGAMLVPLSEQRSSGSAVMGLPNTGH